MIGIRFYVNYFGKDTTFSANYRIFATHFQCLAIKFNQFINTFTVKMKKSLLSVIAGMLAIGCLQAADLTPVEPPRIPTVTAGDEQYDPEEVTDLAAVWNVAEGGFVISMKTPARSFYTDWSDYSTVYAPLTAIEKIEVSAAISGSNAYTVVHTFENPPVGETISYVEKSLEHGKTYDFKVVVFANGGLESYPANKYDVLAGAVPAKIGDVKVETVKGQMPVTLTFNAPSTYKDSDTPLTSLTKIELIKQAASYLDEDEVLQTIDNPTPGREYTFTINDPTITGNKTFKLVAYNEDGASDRTDVTVFIGEDTPGAVTGLKAVELENGDVELTWSAPTTGANNGYFDASALTYTVSVRTPGSWGDDSKVVSENQSECRYVYAASSLTEATRMRFCVTASNSAGNGRESLTGYIVTGPAATLPFSEGFNNATGYSVTYDHLWGTSTDCTSSYPPDWTVAEYAYVGSAQVKPESGQGGLLRLSTYNYTPESTFMLTSSKIDISAAPAVEVSFSVYVPADDQGDAAIGAEISFDRGQTFTRLAYCRFNDSAAKGWQKLSGSANRPDGATHATLRIFAEKAENVANDFVIDEISLKSTEAEAAVYPASVSDFTAQKTADGGSILVRLTAPTHSHASLGDVNNAPLQSISRIVLGRQIGYATDYVTVHTFDNPGVGEQLTYTDTDLSAGGEYCYRAVVYVGDNCDYGNYTEVITVGQIPGEVTDFTAASTKGSAPVVLTFRTPAVDNNGNPLEEVRGVRITRYNTETIAWDELTTMTDGMQPDKVYTYSDASVTSGQIYEYRIVVLGSAGDSYGTSRSVYVGVDEPVEPSNLTATLNAEGRVVLTWEAPTEGRNGGYVDTEHLTYVVQRGNGYSDYDAVMLKSGVTETTFTDPTEFGEEEIVKYFVKAVSNNIQGISAVSNSLLVGKPSQLPFIENFDTPVGTLVQADHGSWSITSSDPTADGWSFAELAYFMLEGQVMPVSGDAGLAYVLYGQYSSTEREDYLTSGNIDIEAAAKPEVTFHVYGVPGYNNSLDVEVSFDGGEFRSIKHLSYTADFKEEGWARLTLPVEKPEGAKLMRLRFHAHKGSYSCSVAVDDIRVDAEGSGIESVEALDGVMIAAAGGNIIVSGADADTPVVISDMAGRTLHSAKGDCTVAAAAGVYAVRVGATAVKLIVK